MKTHPLFPKLQELHDKQVQIDKEFRELKDKIMNDLSPIKVGQVIRFETGKTFRTGRVTKITNGMREGSFAYEVKLIHKNGTIGRWSKVYEYQNPTLCELPQVTKP